MLQRKIKESDKYIDLWNFPSFDPLYFFFHQDTSKKVLFLSLILGCMVMVDGCHTDKVYLQPIKEIKFLDDWAEKFIPANVTGIVMA